MPTVAQRLELVYFIKHAYQSIKMKISDEKLTVAAQLWYNKATEVVMPVIVPVRDLKDTNRISELCHKEMRPVFVTKNGYGDMVIMSMAYYEEAIGRNAIYAKLEEARADVAAGRVKPMSEVMNRLRSKFDVQA